MIPSFKSLLEQVQNGATTVRLNSVPFQEENADTLFRVLKTNETVTALDLSDMKISSDNILNLSETLSMNRTIVKIDLSRSGLNNTMLKTLLLGLQQHQQPVTQGNCKKIFEVS